MDERTLTDRLDHAILAHSQWKRRLKKTLETGCAIFNIEEARNSSLCEFGRWLNSKEGKFLLKYPDLIKLHEEFHEEVYQILVEALLHDNLTGAADRMKLGSHFGQLTAKLINRLAELKNSIK